MTGVWSWGVGSPLSWSLCGILSYLQIVSKFSWIVGHSPGFRELLVCMGKPLLPTLELSIESFYVCLQLSSFINLLLTSRIWGYNSPLILSSVFSVKANSIPSETIFSRTLWVFHGFSRGSLHETKAAHTYFSEKSLLYLRLLRRWLRDNDFTFPRGLWFEKICEAYP